ncbi:hypothetical protein IE81DRAFT_303229 [Ceraceosorus guamensis]|uniref:Condensin complex subunit 1 n=1 Tax=Ceraceosorus guamensis TaxID=1522189 RepID=A0A316VW96_9BASI|nr:hypothetical protein IE81DRAFT_303229 [Ceraceosorus guamensis]PWN41740.1 hypothetical protein IE81DRAFT_303229 [Ceraceosorus guamensis]
MSALPAFVLADELLAVRDAEYTVAGEHDLSTAQSGEVATLLTSTIDALSNVSSIENDDTFSQLLSLVKHYAVLAGNQRLTLLDGLSAAYNSAIDGATASLSEGTDAYRAWASPLERLAFAMHWVIVTAERAASTREERAAAPPPKGVRRGGRGGAKAATTARLAAAAPQHSGAVDLTGYDWSGVLPGLLNVLLRSLRLSTALLFPATATRDAFVSCSLKPALMLQETESHLKLVAVKTGIFRIICTSVKNHAQAFAVQSGLIQALAYYEHLAEPSAELLFMLASEYDHERLADDVLRDVGAREFGGMDTKSPRCFARFLIRLTELAPRMMLRNISLLMKHLDSESYPMRNSLIEILGLMIKELTMTDDALPSGDQAGRGDGSSHDTAASGTGGNEGNADAQRGSAEARKKQVKHFWELLFERFLDVNSYVRVKAVAVCVKLCDLPAKFPSQRTTLTDLASQALCDKSSSVRKGAIALLTRLVLTHPYGVLHGGELDYAEWQARLTGVDAQLKQFEAKLNLPADNDEEEEEEEELDEEEAIEEEASIIMATPRRRAERRTKKRRSSTGGQGALDVAAAGLSAEDAQRVITLRLTRRYYVDALHFIHQLSGAMPLLSQLLVSKSKAEVLESMEFFRVAYEYRIPGADAGVRKMVHLIWTKDNTLTAASALGEDGDGSQLKGIRSRLLEVYRALYFDPLPDLSGRDNVARIARNMVERTFNATLAELTSLEELLRTMCAEDMVHPEVVAKLWGVYSAPRAMPRAQRRGAIIVLSMLAVAHREIVADHVDAMLSVGLGPLGSKDIVLAKYTCVALSRVGGSIKKIKGALSDEQVRFPMSHPMFAKLRAAVMWQAPSSNVAVAAAVDKGEWFSLAENAIQTIYLLGEQPDALCSEIIRSMTLRVFGPHGPALKQAGDDASDDGTTFDTGSDADDVTVREGTPKPDKQTAKQSRGSLAPAFSLAQLLFIVGHVALKQIVYIELIEREYKRRKAEADKAKLAARDANAGEDETAGGKAKKGRSKKGGKADAPSSDAPTTDELDQVAGNAEDEIGDVVGEVREKELLFGHNSLLALFGPVCGQICSAPKAYPNEYLRKAAVMSMCKFMCVSSEYCEAHLPLLLSIVASSTDAVVRSNVVIALGDIAISFGHLVDENSERLYAGLSDRDLGVKKHTLMVLTHLILNGMIKVKGQLGEMAKCIEDPEERVSDLAKLFFSELATKENAVYNNLPDIISHLSIGAHAVDEDKFARIMGYIFQFIDKEKQAENVVEKLCQRFRLTTEPRQWRDVAYCLSLLPFKSDRSVKRLIEGLPFYQDKLHDVGVYNSFQAIVQSIKGRGRVPGAAAAMSGSEGDLAEFEAILEQYKAKAEEETALAAAAARKKSRKKGENAFKKPTMPKNAAALATHRSRKRGNSNDDDQDDQDEDDENVTPTKPAKAPQRQTRPTRGRARKVVAESDDEDDDDANDSDY